MSEDVARSLGLRDLHHVGIVVRDLDEAVRRWSDELGVGPWGRMSSELPARYRGRNGVSGARVAFARSGSSHVELVQPTGGPWTAQTVLDERGEGLYHLGYWVADFAGTLERAERLGIAVDWLAGTPGAPIAAYFDAGRTFGVHLEIVNAAARPMIERMIERAT